MNFAAARKNMVNSQILTNRVTDPLVIKALASLPREEFARGSLPGALNVPVDELRECARELGDGDIIVNCGHRVAAPVRAGPSRV